MVVDPISNLINGLKNASVAGKETFELPYTKVNHAILETLKRDGYITDVEKHGKKIAKSLTATLKYEEDGTPTINGVKRVSKFSKRVYQGVSEIRPIRNGYGHRIFSTPQGILSNFEAKKANVGGEVLFEIW